MTAALPEIGCYGLAGHTASPLDVVAEAQHAEWPGIGAMFLSERFNVKDAGVMAGAVAAATEQIGIGTSAHRAEGCV
ncbi:LLM class flavin-dependent oxidoreductase [Spirillospora sp. NPDC048819]|uniref:LLM class flavin-dependent oxidoreductase n=1 Tax=Spirillospora sp. NPDC048819 TaxID=3155268 RepID=UPI0033EBA808